MDWQVQMIKLLLMACAGIAVACFYNVIASPFIGELLAEFGIRPAEWASPTARFIRETLASEQFRLGLSGAAGALFYSLMRALLKR